MKIDPTGFGKHLTLTEVSRQTESYERRFVQNKLSQSSYVAAFGITSQLAPAVRGVKTMFKIHDTTNNNVSQKMHQLSRRHTGLHSLKRWFISKLHVLYYNIISFGRDFNRKLREKICAL